MICDRLFLYEHQSTKNPTCRFAICCMWQILLGADKRHVFVWRTSGSNSGASFCGILQRRTENGGTSILRLSDLYRPKTEHPYLELETLVLNINKGYNAELMEKCRELHDYSVFVALVREKRKNGMNLKHAVNEAIDECIHQDIMADFLRRNRAEVVKMSIYEYDEEKNYKMLQEQYWNMGHERGKSEGIVQGRAEGMLRKN